MLTIFLLLYVEYRKGLSTQHALLRLIETWKKVLDRKEYGGTVLLNLSKTFDPISYDLLLAKLHVYGFNNKSLRLIKIYLSLAEKKSQHMI